MLRLGGNAEKDLNFVSVGKRKTGSAAHSSVAKGILRMTDWDTETLSKMKSEA